jgi:hypothetical protein
MKEFQSAETIGSEYEEIGHVSVSGLTTLDEVTEALAKKAEEKGADAFKVISAGGNNQQHGSAIIYKLNDAAEPQDSAE